MCYIFIIRSLENTIRQKGPNMAPSVMTDKNVEDEEACSAITDTDSEDALTEIDHHAYANSQGGKFKQLQRRWERLADQRTSKEDATASNEMSPLKLRYRFFIIFYFDVYLPNYRTNSISI